MYICTCMCARLVNLCVRMFVQLHKHVCVYLYNVYACVRTLGQADGSSREDFAAASEQQLLCQRDYRNATTLWMYKC